jgi:hypothetical protein
LDERSCCLMQEASGAAVHAHLHIFDLLGSQVMAMAHSTSWPRSPTR